MAEPVVMPKPGNGVENCILVSWKKQVGEQVDAGDTLCEIETDKAVMEVDSAFSGSMLAHFFEEGAEIPVFTNIAAIGQPGDNVETLRPASAAQEAVPEPPAPALIAAESIRRTLGGKQIERTRRESVYTVADQTRPPQTQAGVSPRATKLADSQNVDTSSLAGSGPQGRIIERDVRAAVERQQTMTPLAKRMVAEAGFEAPIQGTGPRGRILAADLTTGAPAASARQEFPDFEAIPVQGVRRVIAKRMLESLQSTAQLTLNRSADAHALLAYRERLKASDETLGLRQVTINDLILFTVSRTLKRHAQLNALFTDDVIYQHNNVNLSFAVDSSRGLIAPVLHGTDRLSLRQIARESKRLATACQDGTIAPDELKNGTFTVTNLGSLDVESFTPILNPPQVAILGVGSINLKPVETDGEVTFRKQISLSLTINHQVVDGAPAARFLQALARGLAEVDLLLAE